MSEILNVLQGGFNLLDWIRSGRAAVTSGTSAARAATCVACTKNGEGPLTQWFTEPASEVIKHEIEKRADFKLKTPYDAALGVCEACHCPLKTKVHEPIDLVLKHLKPSQEEKLGERCWIRFEDPRQTEPEKPEGTVAKGMANRRRLGLLNWYRRKRGQPDQGDTSRR